ncbi:hypothetical protein [Peristeroidobacter agariperforans]|uniref:hypothetical protein n=1 Tax=Peristeroidobacter agariperforans TaxID=268404 RepID=UPI00101D699E|nr:hypothetical protein [Peristeroidobacter agariperforans]
MIRLMDRRVVSSVVMMAALATAVTVIVKNHEAREIAAAAEPTDAPAAERLTRPLVSPLVPEQQRSLATAEDPADAAFLAQVEHKYRFLIADVEEAHVDELRRRLLERESQIDVGSRSRIDAGIGKLLPAESFAYYQALKDSDLEQHHLAEYTGGISNVAPLDERQERIVLNAKLRQKQRYATVMRDVGLDRDSLSKEERAYAHAGTAEALKQYMDDFLAEVAPALSQEQYVQLKNYETTEFARELSRLQQRINAK